MTDDAARTERETFRQQRVTLDFTDATSESETSGRGGWWCCPTPPAGDRLPGAVRAGDRAVRPDR